MGWEARNGRGAYYTRSRKVGIHVIREYIGTGLAAEAIACMDQVNREERQRAAQQWHKVRMKLEGLDQMMAEYYRGIEIIMRQTLIAAGYHQHARGE